MGSEEDPLRRKVRRRIFEDRDINHLSFNINDPEEAQQVEVVSKYLLTANVEIDWMHSGEAPLRAKVAQLSNLTCGHMQIPRIGLRWNRDDVSIDRAVIAAFPRGRGRVYLEGEDAALECVAFLIWPGTKPVLIESNMDASEIIYVSLPARWLAGLPVPLEPVTAAGDGEAAALAPLCAFLASLCRLSPQGAGGVGHIRQAVEEVVKAMARIIVGPDYEDHPTLFRRAMEVVFEDHSVRDLNAQKIAATLDVSVRKLQRAFEEEGTTSVAEIRKTRALAARALRSEQPAMASEEIARQAGFGSASSMFRAVREQADLLASEEQVAF
ncbi:AraC family transcriptional regulator [Leucobacter viscericola]|uniref:AraC family transcriptional regulator n=1 Tax=Leucobacter viscericola TaxID=2714935 RepID=A0A6G7XFX1_9MICO|nr:helix-turn-helix domain-containing protein [Leucobacter viscericola]QIK63339.1 AraC family transcriptional regulator [Leucobacter viscericola]